jgi:hypothetical protein
MQYSRVIFFEDDIAPKDDIDKLFEKLQQLEPPPSLISKILKNIRSQVPPKRPADMPRSENYPWDELYGLVVRNDKCQPC